jgi:hypothetical protein
MIDKDNRQRLHIPGLGNIFGSFFFEFSKVNIIKIKLTKIFLIRIFQFLIYALENHIRILQRQSDDGSYYHSAQNLIR